MDAVSITGLQGTGKTTLAEALGSALDAVVFSRDPLMDVLIEGGIPFESDTAANTKGLGELGYDLQTTLLREQLRMGRSVVLECVVGLERRAEWERIAVSQGARYWLIDTICSDVEMHHRRFVERGPIELGDSLLSWGTVKANRDRYRVHPHAAFIADSMQPLATNVNAIMELIRSARANER